MFYSFVWELAIHTIQHFLLASFLISIKYCLNEDCCLLFFMINGNGYLLEVLLIFCIKAILLDLTINDYLEKQLEGEEDLEKTIREVIKKNLEINDLDRSMVMDRTLWLNLIHVTNPT